MMNKIVVLTKLFCKSTFEDTFNFKNRDRFSIVVSIALSLLIIFCMSMPFLMIVSTSYNLLSLYNNQNILLEMVMSLATVLVLLFGIVMILNVFFFSKDVEVILPLPVKPGAIILSKLLSCIVYCIGIMLFVVPPLVMFGILDGKGIIYYIVIILSVLIGPVLPLCITGIISLVLMRFSNFSKKKDFFKVLMSIIGIGLALGLQFIIPAMSSLSNGEISPIQNTSTKYINNAIISSRTLIMALVDNGIESILYIGVTILISVISIILFYYAGQKLYLKSAMGSKESSSKRENLNDETIEKKLNKRSMVTNFIMNDIKILVRTPAYFISCILIIVLVPIIFVVMFTQSSLVSEGNMVDFTTRIAAVPVAYLILGVGAVAGFISGLNPTASSSFSREGQEFYYRKYLPIDAKTQVFAKYLTALILNIFAYILILILAIVALKINVEVIILGSILGFLFINLNSVIGVIIDMKSPKLIWDNEQRAVKNNINVTKAMFASIIVIGVMILVGIITSGSIILMVFTESIILVVANYIAIRTMLNDAGEDIMLVE